MSIFLGEIFTLIGSVLEHLHFLDKGSATLYKPSTTRRLRNAVLDGCDEKQKKERKGFFLLQFRRKFESVSDPVSTSILLNVTFFLSSSLLQLGHINC
jgi:hypothetical protein